jgi:hypothetical protein
MKLIASLVLFLALAASAWAAPRLHLVAPDLPTPLVTDDARYAVRVGPDAEVSILDTRTDARADMQLLVLQAQATANRIFYNVPRGLKDVGYRILVARLPR